MERGAILQRPCTPALSARLLLPGVGDLEVPLRRCRPLGLVRLVAELLGDGLEGADERREAREGTLPGLLRDDLGRRAHDEREREREARGRRARPRDPTAHDFTAAVAPRFTG